MGKKKGGEYCSLSKGGEVRVSTIRRRGGKGKQNLKASGHGKQTKELWGDTSAAGPGSSSSGGINRVYGGRGRNAETITASEIKIKRIRKRIDR